MAEQRVLKKLSFARRAFNECLAAQEFQDRDNFEYHFGTFLVHARAAAEYLCKDAADHDDVAWWYNEQADPDISTVVYIRNQDVHEGTLSLNRGYQIHASNAITFGTWFPAVSPRIRVRRACLAAIRRARRILPWCAAPAAVPMFTISPSALPPDFMTRNRWEEAAKPTVTQHLVGRPLIEIAREFLDKLPGIIDQGEALGKITP